MGCSVRRAKPAPSPLESRVQAGEVDLVGSRACSAASSGGLDQRGFSGDGVAGHISQPSVFDSSHQGAQEPGRCPSGPLVPANAGLRNMRAKSQADRIDSNVLKCQCRSVGPEKGDGKRQATSASRPRSRVVEKHAAWFSRSLAKPAGRTVNQRYWRARLRRRRPIA